MIHIGRLPLWAVSFLLYRFIMKKHFRAMHIPQYDTGAEVFFFSAYFFLCLLTTGRKSAIVLDIRT